MRKKIYAIVFALVVALYACMAVACQKTDGEYVVITVKTERMDSGDTLKTYMDDLQADNVLTYTVKDGMLLSINGKAGKPNEYWMLYTNDTEYADESWGTCIYKDVTYFSATLGMESLPVKDGYTYIWHLQAF